MKKIRFEKATGEGFSTCYKCGVTMWDCFMVKDNKKNGRRICGCCFNKNKRRRNKLNANTK